MYHHFQELQLMPFETAIGNFCCDFLRSRLQVQSLVTIRLPNEMSSALVSQHSVFF